MHSVWSWSYTLNSIRINLLFHLAHKYSKSSVPEMVSWVQIPPPPSRKPVFVSVAGFVTVK